MTINAGRALVLCGESDILGTSSKWFLCTYLSMSAQLRSYVYFRPHSDSNGLMSTFEWSTPVRRSSNGARLLDPIPLEVYQEILSHFQENDDMTASEVRRNLCNIALVCRYFSSIALPRIFAEMSISGGCQDSATNRFCRALASNKEPATSLARYIKTFKFASFMLYGAPTLQIQSAFFSMYCIALGKMVSIEAIDLNCVTIDKRIIKAMRKLPLLRSLRFSLCVICDSDVEAFKSFIHSLHLETLVIFQIVDVAFRSVFTSPNFSFRHLKHLEVNDWKIIQHLAEHEDVLPIQSLTIHSVPDPRILSDVFSRMPEISQLHIYRMKLVESITFPNSILPKLSFFDGPPALAHSLVQARPIKKIWLLGTLCESLEEPPPTLPKLDHDFWTTLGRSSAPIGEIAMPRPLYDVGSLQQHLPNASILKVCWCLGNWMYNLVDSRESLVSEVKAFCEKWPPNPSVLQIVFEFSPCADEELLFYDLKSQHKMLCRDISPRFPNVEQVNFTSIVNWRRSSIDETWRATIPKVKRRYFYSKVVNERDELVDYGDCFAAVFDSKGVE